MFNSAYWPTTHLVSYGGRPFSALLTFLPALGFLSCSQFTAHGGRKGFFSVLHPQCLQWTPAASRGHLSGILLPPSSQQSPLALDKVWSAPKRCSQLSCTSTALYPMKTPSSRKGLSSAFSGFPELPSHASVRPTGVSGWWAHLCCGCSSLWEPKPPLELSRRCSKFIKM